MSTGGGPAHSLEALLVGQVSQRGVRVTARETDRWRDRGRGVADSLPRPGAWLSKKLCALRSTDKREEPVGPLPVGPAAQRGRGREVRRLISAHSPSLCSPPSSFPPLHGLRRTLIPLSCCFFRCRWVVGRKESWTGPVDIQEGLPNLADEGTEDRDLNHLHLPCASLP